MKGTPSKYKYRIGVMGRAGRGRKLPEPLLKAGREVGREIVKNGCILITGACMGVPQEAAEGASEMGGTVLGFSPAATLKEHLEPPISYPFPPKNCILIFTGFGKEARNILSIRNCNAVILVGGSVGVLMEFTLAYHMGNKVIGILEGVGGIGEKIPEIVEAFKKDTGCVFIFESDPKKMVKKVIKALETKKNE